MGKHSETKTDVPIVALLTDCDSLINYRVKRKKESITIESLVFSQSLRTGLTDSKLMRT